MLKENKKVETTVETEVALDECGGHVMLSLKCGDDKFCQALSVGDMGRLLEVASGIEHERVCCEEDLIVRASDDYSMMELAWNAEGRDCRVELDGSEILVFEQACRSYCRQLFRTNKGV